MKTSQLMSEIRGSDSRELRIRLEDLRKEIFDLRCRSTSEDVPHTARFRTARREIARILTVLGERDRDAAAKERQ
ncbi:MAG: 50S ribosomal protein L29 [Planctomycetota bacterium]